MLQLRKKNIKQIYFLPVYLAGILFVGMQKVLARPTLDNAQDFTKTVAERSGVDQGSVEGVASNTLKAGISMVGLLFFALMFYGGFMWMTAHGNEDQVRKGREAVIAAAIGLTVVVAAYAVTSLIGKII